MNKESRKNLTYTDEFPADEQYWNLFLTTGWNEEYQLKISDVKTILENSSFCFSAYDNNTLVGFGRVVTDKKVNAIILDLIVHPDFQGKSIGKVILDQLVVKCKELNIHDIQLFSAKNKLKFYEKRGFVKRPDDAPGMEFKNKI